MVDKDLLRDLKAKMEAGPAGADPSYTLKAFELFKQLAAENEEIGEMARELDLKAQVVISGTDKKYWIVVSRGEITYGEGTIASPTITLTSRMEVAIGMLYGEFNPVSAYMAGDVVIEGHLPAAIQLQELIEVALEDFKELVRQL